MHSVTVLEEACRPEGLSLDGYTAGGAFGYFKSRERSFWMPFSRLG
jgi:hypothetical protein